MFGDFFFFSISITEENLGVLVNGIAVNNIRYVDDTVIMATFHENLQKLMNALLMKALEKWASEYKYDKNEMEGFIGNAKNTNSM